MKLQMSRSRRFWSLAACLMMVCLLWVGASQMAAAGNATYVPNEYIVQAAAGSTLSAVQRSVAAVGGTVAKILPLPDTYLVRLDSTKSSASAGTQGSIARTAAVSGSYAAASPWVIKNFTPNAICTLNAIPGDEYWSKQWDMVSMNMPAAWNLQKGSSSVTVAVIDTGVAKHPDLVDRIVPGYDFIDNDADPSNDLVGHGTHVSGTIAAQGDNQMGICGVCWNGVNILPVRVFGGPTSSLDVILQGMDYALQQHADVVNMSYGFSSSIPVPPLQTEIQQMAAAGMVLCASAGNGALTMDPFVELPAAYPECIAVASVGPDDEIAPYSSYGPGSEVDVAAPGGDSFLGMEAMVWSTCVDNSGPTPIYTYEYMEGTSMACPHVAGAAALLLSQGVAPADIATRLKSTARKPSSGMDAKKYGAGIVDMNAALANGSLSLTKPLKGSVVSANPDIKVTLRGIDTSSLAVYVLDDMSTSGPGPADTPVLAGTTAAAFLDSTASTLSFNWSQISASPLDPGLHFIYVSGKTTINGDVKSDWGTFTVASKIIPAGQYLFAFPYQFANTSPDGVVTIGSLPSDVLLDASTAQPLDFRLGSPDRARLIRWNAPQSYYVSYLTGILDPSLNTPRFDDKSWLNPVTNMLLSTGAVQPVPTAGGFLVDKPNSLQFPAGTGFWLILQKDAVISNSLTELSAPQGFKIPLYKGWNLIGNPFGHDVPLSSIHLSYQGQPQRTLDEDQMNSRPWIDSNIYGYSSGSGYEIVPADKRLLEPFKGYWVRANFGGIAPQESLYMIVQ